MFGRKAYTRDELDTARDAVDRQLATYRRLADAVAATGDGEAQARLAELEPVLFNNMTLVLDRHFVHRLRAVAGKDGNPLNEVELLSESLLANDGVLRTGKVVKFKPDQTVLKLEPGDRIDLGADDFGRLSDAFLAEIESRFL